MKKMSIAITLVVVLALALTGAGLAQDEDYGLTVVKGNLTAIDPASVTVESVKGGTFTFVLPAAELALPALEIGDLVMVKATTQADGSLVVWDLRSLEKGNRGKGSGAGDPAEAGKLNRAYCDPNKQGVYHPIAEKLAQRYGVSPEWVTGYYCDGQSMGAIMLALKTARLQGIDPEGLLARRANGESWGLIWQELGLIGSEKDVNTPPGQLKK